MIAAGAGVPLHFLAEPESSTRTTAESAGGPTYRHFEQRQNYFIWIIQDLLKIVVARRAQVDRRITKKAQIEVRGADISARDNVALSLAGQNIVNMLGDLRDRLLITDEEYLRLAYRFAGEIVDVEDMLAAAKLEGIPIKASAASPRGARSEIPTDPNVTVAGTEKDLDPTKKIKGVGRGKGSSKVLDAETGELKASISNPAQ